MAAPRVTKSTVPVSPPPRGGLAARAPRAEPGRGLPHRPGYGSRLVGTGAGVRGSGVSRGSRLHGPGELGHGLSRRLAVRLRAAQRHPDLQPDGDPAAGARRQAGHRDGARPGPSVPRPLLATHLHPALGDLRDRDSSLRPGGGDRLGDRAEPAVRGAAAVGHRDHRARRAAGAVPTAPGLPAAGGAGHRPDRDDRRVLHLRDPDLTARPLRGGGGVRAGRGDPAQP